MKVVAAARSSAAPRAQWVGSPPPAMRRLASRGRPGRSHRANADDCDGSRCRRRPDIRFALRHRHHARGFSASCAAHREDCSKRAIVVIYESRTAHARRTLAIDIRHYTHKPSRIISAIRIACIALSRHRPGWFWAMTMNIFLPWKSRRDRRCDRATANARMARRPIGLAQHRRHRRAPAPRVAAQRLPRGQWARCLSSAPLASAAARRRAQILTNPPDGPRPPRRRGRRSARAMAAADKRLPVDRAFAKQAGTARRGMPPR